MQSQNSPQNNQNNQSPSKITNNNNSLSKVVTIVRIRPTLIGQGSPILTVINKNVIQLQINGVKRKQQAQLVLGSQSTQRQVFQTISPLIQKAGQGFNISLLTYGQTGSGKTHTMFGSDWNNIVKKLDNKNQIQNTFIRQLSQDENHAGIIPRTINLLFNKIISRRPKYIKVYVSFLQLYNENMKDLLDNDSKSKEQKLIIHQNPKDGIYVEGLSQIVVNSIDQCMQIMQRGQRNRAVRQTIMNAKSSRSHTIFTILIQQIFPAQKTFRRVKINLCDLAGSQKIYKKQVMSNQHLSELKNINLSLTTLGKVIASLSISGSTPPYRQSKLTRILQDTLGGNTNTAIVATLSASASCLQQSLNTLKFLQRARQIKGQVIAKVFSDNPQMRQLQRQVAYLRDIIKNKNNTISGENNIQQQYRKLQIQNKKLKGLVDEGVMQRLRKQNIRLKQQIVSGQLRSQSNMDTVSNKFNTIDHGQSVMYGEMISSASQSHTLKMARKEGKSVGSKTEDTLSQKRSTFQRGTGISMFPSINNGPKKTSKILQRILEIQKVKQKNKMKLQQQLKQIDQRSRQRKTSPFSIKQ